MTAFTQIAPPRFGTMTAYECPGAAVTAPGMDDPKEVDVPKRTLSVEERLWPRINKDGPVPQHRPDLGRCWLWTGSTEFFGYGRIIVGGKSRKVHRMTYELLVGSIPAGLELDHLCRVPLCCNPSHLEPVTHRENIRRGMSPLAIAARSDQCAKGHDLTGDNLYLRKDGTGRVCRRCHQEYHKGRIRPLRECIDCGRVRPHCAHGRCGMCDIRWRKAGKP